MTSHAARNDRSASTLIKLAGYSSIVLVTVIFLFLLREGLPALGEVELSELFNSIWYPTEGYYGIWPLLGGSLLVTIAAVMIALPFGVGTAVYISEIAPQAVKEILKPIIEVLAGLPSVVLGFIGYFVIAPFLRKTLGLATGLTALTGAILLGMIAIPTIVSIAEDALNAVPKSYREASIALGATRWQTIWGVTLPAARSGVITAVMLGVGRALGETMAVMLVTGNAPVVPKTWDAILLPVRTMTATIASEMGEVARNSVHYHVLFFIGIILFLLSLGINIAASWVSFKKKKRSERVLS